MYVCSIKNGHADSNYSAERGNSKRDQGPSSVRQCTVADLINAPKAYGRKRNLFENLQRVCGISRGFLFFSPSSSLSARELGRIERTMRP